MFLSRLSINENARRNFLFFCAALFICIAVLVYFMVHNNAVFDRVGQNIQINNLIIAKTEKFSANLEATISHHLSYLIMGDQEHKDRYQSRSNQVLETMKDLALLTAGNAPQNLRVGGLHNNFESLSTQLQIQMDKRLADQNLSTREVLRAAENVDILRNRIVEIYNAILVEENRQLELHFAQLDHQKNIYFIILIIGGIAAAALLVMFNLFLLSAQSQRLLAETELKDTEKRFKIAIEGMNDGVFDWDLETDQVFYSSQFFQMLGYDRDDTHGSIDDFRALIHEEDQERVWEYVAHYLGGNLSEYSITFRMKHSSGKWIWIQSRAKAIFNEQGQAIRMVGANADITYLKEYQEFLKREKRLAEQANEAKSEFLAHMSHEIRTPLTAVNGIAEIFENNIDQFSPRHQRLIGTLKTSISSLKDLINDILDFSKIESGEIELEEKYFEMDRFFEQIISITSIRASEKDINYSFNYDAVRDIQFYGDPVRLRQVFINLIGNAIKFTNTGSVEVKVYFQKKGRVKFLRFDVIDTGVGIAKDKLELIFERFKQSDASVSRSFGGTGLGLSISKKLVDIMGGEIKLKSKLGKGSTFTVLIPMAESKIKMIKEVDPDLKGKAKDQIKAEISDDKKILIVEDYEGNIVILGYILEQMNLDYDVAHNGLEAVEKWKDNHYDAILMDIQMPEMDGFSATAEIRKSEEENALTPTPIIGMTAHALVGDREKCLKAGMNAYIPKPINEKELKTEIMTVLSKTDDKKDA